MPQRPLVVLLASGARLVVRSTHPSVRSFKCARPSPSSRSAMRRLPATKERKLALLKHHLGCSTRLQSGGSSDSTRLFSKVGSVIANNAVASGARVFKSTGRWTEAAVAKAIELQWAPGANWFPPRSHASE